MINKVILMGRLTKDPELRYTGTQKPVCSFTVAVNNGHGEEKHTDFINCVAWNKTAEFISKYFAKGKMIILAGRIGTRAWDGADGKKRYASEVVVSEAAFGESKKEDNSSASEPEEDFIPALADDDCPF